jgi:hypothetical protein
MILTADLHLRSSVPRCRVETEEEWYETQKKILEFIYSFSEPVYIAGDIFHNYNPGNKILELFLSFALQYETHIMMGNHDARNGILDPDSGYGVLQRIIDAGHPFLKSMEPWAWVPFGEEKVYGENNNLIFLHTLSFPSNAAATPGIKYVTARDLSNMYENYAIIVVGDNHTHYKWEGNGHTVLSPGCITKQASDYKDKELKLFRIDIDNWAMGDGLAPIHAITIPDNAELVDDSYILEEHEREDRYNHLVEALKVDSEMTFDFKSNIWHTVSNSEISQNCKAILMEVIPE